MTGGRGWKGRSLETLGAYSSDFMSQSNFPDWMDSDRLAEAALAPSVPPSLPFQPPSRSSCLLRRPPSGRLRRRQWFPRKPFVASGRIVGKRRNDDRVTHHVVGLNALV
jgi:hypothetical protein